MRRYLKILILLLSCNPESLLHAQSDTAFKKSVAVEFAPLALLNSSIRLGVEYNFSQFNAVYFEFGKFEPFYGDKNNGLVVRTELRYFRYPEEYPHSIENTYFSFELFYKHESYMVNDSSLGHYETFSVAKDVGCLNWRFGSEKIFNSGLQFDLSGGLGVRIKYGTNSLTADQNANMQPIYDYGPNIFRNKAGFSVWPNFEFGFKVGYVFH